MSIIYMCRHCSHTIGRVEQKAISAAIFEMNDLTTLEKEYMIQHKANGDVEIKVICESCEKSLQQYPNYYELEYFIQ